MKVINICPMTIVLDDIGVNVMYSRTNEVYEILDEKAARSKSLRWALKNNLLVDVTDGVPEILPKYAEKKIESPYIRRESVLSSEPVDVPKKIVPPSSKTKKNIQDGMTAQQLYEKDGTISLVYSGPASDAGGYANMNRRFMFGLDKRGVRIKNDMIQSINNMDPKTNAELQRLNSVSVPADAPKMYGMTAPRHYDWSRPKYLFTMMETRKLHKDYAENCNCADEVIVPSEWCKQIFQESGVKKPISVVPLGVDTKLYTPEVEPIGFSKNLKEFVFLSVFGWSLRKGYDVLLKAYLQEFTSDDPVTLLISSRYFGSTDECKKQVIRDDVAKVSSMVSNPKKPHIILFGDVLSEQLMPRLYAAADCYVLPSRGEGFGLPFCEAGACELPVIATRYSGQTDFLTDDNSYLIDIDGFRSAEKDLAMISYFYENAEFPILGETAVEQTRAHMRRVYENRDEANAKAKKLRQKILKEYDWDVGIDKMHAKLNSIYEEGKLK